MIRTPAIIAVFIGVVAGMAAADTIHLRNGVRIDGKIINQDDTRVVVDAGGRRTTLRVQEIARIEKNDRTGRLDRASLEKTINERNAELLEKTGLDAAQRRRVDEQVWRLPRADDQTYIEIKRILVGMGREVDLFGYFEYRLPGLLPRFVPGVLDVAVELDPTRARPLVRAQAFNVDTACRAKALELLAAMNDHRSADLFVRGLKDHAPEVRMIAADALGTLGVRQATPALIELLRDPNLRVSNAARIALSRLWSERDNPIDYVSPDEWKELWSKHSGTFNEPVNWETIEPLVPSGAYFHSCTGEIK